MTEEKIRADALRIGGNEAAKVMTALRTCRRPEQLKIITNLQERVSAVFDERLAVAGDKIDCKAGCSFCCHIKVDAYPWDIFPIVEFMKKNFTNEQIEAVHAKAKARREKTQHLTYEQHEQTRMPCPLLRDGKCSVYPVRPLSCRRHHSHNVALCESGFNNPTVEGGMVEVQEIRTTLAVVIVRSAEAFEESGYDAAYYDLSAALDEALSNPKAYKRWREGKRAFSKNAIAKEPIGKPKQKAISVSDLVYEKFGLQDDQGGRPGEVIEPNKAGSNTGVRVSTNYLNSVVEPFVRRFCGPLFFTSSLQTPIGNIHANGTFGLVDTGQRKVLVTCHHVWNDFNAMRAEKPDLHLGLCLDMPNPIGINPKDFLIDEDKRCDLVTFDMKEMLEICAAGNCEFFNLDANPSPQVNVGDIIYLIGFPGKGRIEEAKAVGFGRQPIGVQATQVGKFSFFSDVSNLNLQAHDFAGISGCPCFVVPGEGGPIKLVGFATGYTDEGKRLQFTYASYIKADGTIQYMS